MTSSRYGKSSVFNAVDLPRNLDNVASPTMKRAIGSLRDALPHARVLVLEGEQHNAMDTNPRRFAEAVGDSLLGTEKVKP